MLRWTSLQGGDKGKVLRLFELAKVLPEPRASAVRAQWDRIMRIDGIVRSRDYATEAQIEALEREAREFISEWTRASVGEVGQPGYVPGAPVAIRPTPYMHAAAYHFGPALRKARELGAPLLYFSAEGIEKKNHMHANAYFAKTQRRRSTSKPDARRTDTADLSHVFELMELENRLLYAHVNQGLTLAVVEKEASNRLKRKYTLKNTAARVAPMLGPSQHSRTSLS